MANTPDLPLVRAESIADGSTTQFTIPFSFLERGYVYATVDGEPVDFEWVNDSLIIIEPAPPEGAVVVRYRSTFSEHARHNFEGGVPFRPRFIDENNTQLFNVMQETVNSSNMALELSRIAERNAAEALSNSQLAVQEAKDAVQTALHALENAFGYTKIIDVDTNTVLDFEYGGYWVRANPEAGTTIELTVVPHTVSTEFTPAEIVVECVGEGSVLFVEGPGQTVSHMQGTAPVLSEVGGVAALKQTAIGAWSLYGALEDL